MIQATFKCPYCDSQHCAVGLPHEQAPTPNCYNPCHTIPVKMRLVSVRDDGEIKKERPMASPYDTIFGNYLREIDNQTTAFRASQSKTGDQVFADLNVVVGDRIRLTEGDLDNLRPRRARKAKKDGAVLEGKVAGIKTKNGVTKVKVAGFEVAGNQVWWPVRDYHVEVLHRVYRPTDDDLMIADMAGMSEDAWKNDTDFGREEKRKTYGPRLQRLRSRLAPSVVGGQVIASGTVTPQVLNNGDTITVTNTYTAT